MEKQFFFRHGHRLILVGFLLIITLFAMVTGGHEPPVIIRTPTLVDPSAPAYVSAIREGRAQIAPMEESLLPKITEQYNLDFAGHRGWAESCLKYRETFLEAEQLTLYPAELVAGLGMHESAGCKMSAKDWAGGRGLMQITSPPSKSELKDAAVILGITPDQVSYKTDATHNVIIGLVRLDRSERALGSRFHGLLAYNMGQGGVKKTMRGMGYDIDSPPSILDMKPHLAHTAKMKPRIYVQRVVASIVMMDRAMRGLPLERLEAIKPSDVPGWNPVDDGADWTIQFGAK